MALSDILSTVNFVLALLDKLAFIAVCLYFGSLVFKGWKGRSNLIFRIISIIFLGIICFFGGLIVQEFLGWSFFASSYISSIIIAIISYLIIRLISTGFKVKNKYATSTDIVSLSNDIKKLKIQVAKLTRALEEKNMMPEPLDEEGIKKSLSAELEKKGMKGFNIHSCSKLDDSWSCIVSSKKGKQELVIDAYTGSIASSKILRHPLEFLYKNPLSTLGIVLFIAFIAILGFNISLSTINSFNNAFDFSFLFSEPLPSGCLPASNVLEAFKDNQVSLTINNTILSNALISELPSYYLIEDMSSAARINNVDYYIATAYTSPVTSLGGEITTSDWSNIYNVSVCVFKSDYTLCECIGGERTDPVLTVPYLIQIGLIEQALQNIILESITGFLGVN